MLWAEGMSWFCSFFHLSCLYLSFGSFLPLCCMPVMRCGEAFWPCPVATFLEGTTSSASAPQFDTVIFFDTHLFSSFFSLHNAANTLLSRVCLHSGQLNGFGALLAGDLCCLQSCFQIILSKNSHTWISPVSCVIPQYRLQRPARSPHSIFCECGAHSGIALLCLHLETLFNTICRDDVIASY